jgi:glycosyltransferase involved in cell wall biosynthesis
MDGHLSTPQAAHRSLHVAVITETYPPEINGVANTLHRMCHGLAARGHRLTLVRPSQGDHDHGSDGDTGIREVPTTGAPLPFYQGLQVGLPAGRIIARTFRESRPDIVYIATEGPLGVSAHRAARRMRLPVIAGFHTNFQAYSRHYGIGLLAPTVLAYLRRFHNRCHCTLVPTRQLADELASRDFRHLRVWPRGVDTELFSPARRDPAMRRAWGIDDGALGVLYVGRIAPEKNIDLAVQAFEAIRAEHPNARFILVGDGPEMKRLKAAHPDFVYRGSRTGQDLAAHYASADLFLFPSTSETFGNVVTESMASGLATVAFGMAAAGEHLRDGINGLVAPPSDPAAFCARAVQGATGDALRATMARAARADALGLRWPAVISRLEDIFNETLDSVTGENSHEPVAAAPERT